MEKLLKLIETVEKPQFQCSENPPGACLIQRHLLHLAYLGCIEIQSLDRAITENVLQALETIQIFPPYLLMCLLIYFCTKEVLEAD